MAIQMGWMSQILPGAMVVTPGPDPDPDPDPDPTAINGRWITTSYSLLPAEGASSPGENAQVYTWVERESA